MLKGIVAFCLIATVLCDGKVPCEIPGPRDKSDSVAIVGAGSAGIHMALRLKEKGFTSVTVYEQGGSIGGNSYERTHRGTTFAYPGRVSRFDNVLRNLMGRYKSADLIKMAPANQWSTIKNNNNKLEELTKRQYIMERGKNHLNNNNETAVKIIMMNTLYAFNNRYNSIFNSGSSCHFTQEPLWGNSKFNSEGSFRDFLNRFNLQLLDPLLEEMTLLGKGYFDEIPATYGLFIFNPTVINGIIQFINSSASPDFVDYAIRNGERKLWQAIASSENLNVKLNSKVERLRRNSLTETTNVHLRVNGQWKSHNFVVWTSNLKTAIKQIWSWKRPEFNAGPSQEEYQNFLRINHAGYRSIYLFDSELLERGSSYIDNFPDDVDNKRSGLYQLYDTYAMYNEQTNANLYKNRAYPKQNNDNSEFRTIMAVNYFTSSDRSNALNYFSKVQNLFNPVNVTYVSQSAESYYPRFSEKDSVNGMLWRILAMQGKYGIWYTGASAYVDNTEMVLKYNNILLDKMKTPTDRNINTTG